MEPMTASRQLPVADETERTVCPECYLSARMYAGRRRIQSIDRPSFKSWSLGDKQPKPKDRLESPKGIRISLLRSSEMKTC